MNVRVVLCCALAVHACLAIRYAYQSPEPAFDFDRYYEIGSTPARSSLDRPAEHPIATVAVFRALARLPGGRVGFGLGVVVFDLIADAIIVAALVWGWGEAAAAVFAVMVILVLDLFFNRVDPWSAAAATLAIAAWRRGSPRLLGAAMALGVGFKLWPLVLTGALFVAPPGWTGPERHFRARGVAAFVAIGAALTAASVLFGGMRGVGQVLTSRGATGWHIEGLVGSVIHLSGSVPRFESGSWRVGSTSGSVAVGLFAAAAPLSVWASWRGARIGRIGPGWLASVALLLLFSAFLSAQYVIWLIPGAAVSWSEGDRPSTYLTALTVFLTTLFWSFFPAVIASHAVASSLVVLRNLALLAVTVRAFARLVQQPDPRGVTGATL